MADNILSDFGINILEEEIDDVIFQTNEFLCDATFTGTQGPLWWILQMCMALAALFSLIVAGQMAFKMMYKNEPLDVMKLLRPLGISLIMCWWYPPADSGLNNSGSSWCVLDFLSYIPNAIGSYTHDLYSAEAAQIEDKFREVQELVFVRDSLYTDLQAQADVARTGTSDPNLIESTMETTGVEEVTQMEKDASKLWFTSLTSGAVVCIDKIVMVIALIVLDRMVGHHILPADPARNAHHIRTDTMGVLAAAQMGRSMGKVADPLPDSAFLWSHALLRGLLCPSAIRHSALHTGREPFGNNGKHTDYGCVSAKFVFSAGYLMAASIVALKCLNLVPDLAAWMIPEGDTAFSTRNFGEGVASQAKMSAQGAMSKVF